MTHCFSGVNSWEAPGPNYEITFCVSVKKSLWQRSPGGLPGSLRVQEVLLSTWTPGQPCSHTVEMNMCCIVTVPYKREGNNNMTKLIWEGTLKQKGFLL